MKMKSKHTKMVLLEKYQTATHKVVILGDAATQGRCLCVAHLTDLNPIDLTQLTYTERTVFNLSRELACAKALNAIRLAIISQD